MNHNARGGTAPPQRLHSDTKLGNPSWNHDTGRLRPRKALERALLLLPRRPEDGPVRPRCYNGVTPAFSRCGSHGARPPWEPHRVPATFPPVQHQRKTDQKRGFTANAAEFAVCAPARNRRCAGEKATPHSFPARRPQRDWVGGVWCHPRSRHPLPSSLPPLVRLLGRPLSTIAECSSLRPVPHYRRPDRHLTPLRHTA